MLLAFQAKTPVDTCWVSSQAQRSYAEQLESVHKREMIHRQVAGSGSAISPCDRLGFSVPCGETCLTSSNLLKTLRSHGCQDSATQLLAAVASLRTHASRQNSLILRTSRLKLCTQGTSCLSTSSSICRDTPCGRGGFRRTTLSSWAAPAMSLRPVGSVRDKWRKCLRSLQVS